MVGLGGRHHLLEPNGKPNSYSDRPPTALLARARICAHSFANAAWLPEGVLLCDVHRIKTIPAALIHGRRDMGSPLGVAWALDQAWPASNLIIVNDSGHTGSSTSDHHKVAVLDAFADEAGWTRQGDCPTRGRQDISRTPILVMSVTIAVRRCPSGVATVGGRWKGNAVHAR